MHRILNSEGWEVEILRNPDGDPETGREPDLDSIDVRLQGCSFLEMRRSDDQYLAEIRLEELEHHSLFLVEADVLRRKGEGDEYYGSDVYYFRRIRIPGTQGEAARYAETYRNEIDQGFFGKNAGKKPR